MDSVSPERVPDTDMGPDTRRRRRLREVLPPERPVYLDPQEWEAAVRWARDRKPLDVVAAELGVGRWPLKRTIEQVLSRLERSRRDDLAALVALPRRQAYLLGLAGVRTTQDLARTPDARLLAIPGIGPTALARIRKLAA
jgi:hypothetical protein